VTLASGTKFGIYEIVALLGKGHGRLRVADLQPDGRIGPLRPVLKVEPEPDISAARVSPDGHLLAYVTDAPGQPELFLTRFPSGEGRWQVTGEAARAPRWARGTHELFFNTGLRGGALFAAKVDPALDPPLGAPALIFRHGGPDQSSSGSSNAYDVTADGQRVLVMRPGPRLRGPTHGAGAELACRVQRETEEMSAGKD